MAGVLPAYPESFAEENFESLLSIHRLQLEPNVYDAIKEKSAAALLVENASTPVSKAASMEACGAA